jgi:hypothetical protein
VPSGSFYDSNDYLCSFTLENMYSQRIFYYRAGSRKIEYDLHHHSLMRSWKQEALSWDRGGRDIERAVSIPGRKTFEPKLSLSIIGDTEEHSGILHQRAVVRQVSGTAELEATFQEFARKWRNETAAMSSITMKSMHPAYQRIIGMGLQVVPLILKEMERTRGHWFWALHAITGENPVAPEDAGDIEQMTMAWLEYGRRRGYL